MDEARRYCTESLEWHPEQQRAYYNLGSIQMERKNWKAACQEFEKGLRDQGGGAGSKTWEEDRKKNDHRTGDICALWASVERGEQEKIEVEFRRAWAGVREAEKEGGAIRAGRWVDSRVKHVRRSWSS